MLHRNLSFLFSSIMKWTVYVNGLRSLYTTIVWSPYRVFYDTAPHFPPDGYIMMVLILSGLILCHTSILFVSILQIIQSRVHKLNAQLHHYKSPNHFFQQGIIVMPRFTLQLTIRRPSTRKLASTRVPPHVLLIILRINIFRIHVPILFHGH